MSKIILLCGPPGSGKSTLAKEYEQQGYTRISQDDMGKQGHWETFCICVGTLKTDVVLDRMNFNKQQRSRYLEYAKNYNYQTEIIVLHESRLVCSERMMKRENHPTIKNSTDANNALNTFFSKYERPTQDEADVITFKYPDGDKPKCIVIDLDGTLANIDHRLHYMKGEKKNWPGFFSEMNKDTVNSWCSDIIDSFIERRDSIKIVLASGRPDNYHKVTESWLKENMIWRDALFMRLRNDSRQDSIVKEIILDFEILTKFKPLFFIDDRQQVVDLWRRRGFVALQCSKGDF